MSFYSTTAENCNSFQNLLLSSLFLEYLDLKV